jgi:HAMP domain-containing protein
MGLRLKFNLVLLSVFVLGLAAVGFVSHRLLHDDAREEVLHSAGLIMEAAMSMRGYTADRITPQLSYALHDEFAPESVPAFAATEMMSRLRRQYPDYVYKEAALNPTNPANRASDWEQDVINAFRADPGRHEISGVRPTPTGPMLYLARPFRISDQACLTCHSVPEAAPASMVKRYGDKNGFGWQMNEAIGMRVVSVPFRVPVGNANRAFLVFMGLLSAIFALLAVILNLMMNRLLVRPITQMSLAAERISTGDFAIPEFDTTGKDEVAQLAQSFNRMRRSLEKAIQLINRQ